MLRQIYKQRLRVRINSIRTGNVFESSLSLSLSLSLSIYLSFSLVITRIYTSDKEKEKLLRNSREEPVA